MPGIALIKENMKRIILSLVIASCAVAASAQPERHTFSLIPHVGAAIANISNESFVYDSNSSGSGKYREGLAVGVDVQYQATDHLAYSIGLGYTRQGCKYEDSDLSNAAPGNYTGYSNVRNNLDYLNVPLMAHFYFAPGLSLNAGVQAGFLLHSNVEFDKAAVTVNKDGSYTYDNKAQHINEDESDMLRKVDFSIPVGLSFEYANVVVDLRYNIGLTKIYKSALSDNECRNKVFALTVGYKLNL